MKKDYLFKVRTTEDINGLWKGSVIYVEKESRKKYKGIHSFYGGSYHIQVPKDKCVKLDDLEEREDLLKAFSPEKYNKLKKDWRKIKNIYK